MSRFLSLALLVPLLLGSRPVAAAVPDDRALARAIDAYVAPLVARGDLSGQLLVHRNGRLVYERSFGMANAELGVPVGPDTRINIASVTKPMTASVAIQLLSEEKFALTDSLTKWFPDFPKGDSIRVTDLLRHRSGIPHETVPDSEMTRPFTAAEIVERVKKLPLDFSPGSRSSYSSGGYEVLARVLELVSGMSYGDLLEARIFGPLGMTHTAHADSRTQLPGRATAYVPGPHGIENAPLADFSALVGAGSVWSTARDLHLFVAGIVGGKLGEGVRQSFVRGGKVDFNGRTGGFKAWAMWDSSTTFEATFTGNTSTGAPDALRRDLPRIAAGESVTPPVAPTLRKEPLAASEAARWEGVYQLENGPRIELRWHPGSGLYSNDWIMLPLADGALYSPRDYGMVRAVPASGGKITRLDWVQGGQSYPAPRVSD